MADIGYLFPGQGAQATGMGRAFYDRYEESRDIYKRANTYLGFDVTALCFEGSPEELARTDLCQPALFVTATAAFAAFHTIAPSAKPIGVVGLSLGELTALAAADSIKFSEGCYLVQARGQAMAECATHHPGTMLAVIGLDESALETLCRASGATTANYNAPEQVVLSGTVESIEQAEGLAKASGAKRTTRLEVTGAFHSPLMQPAADAFKEALAKVEIRTPAFPVISNVTGQPAQDPEDIRQLLIQQIVSPVRWDASMRFLIQSGATRFVEFPPARILAGLLRRIERSVQAQVVNDPKDFEQLSDLLSARL